MTGGRYVRFFEEIGVGDIPLVGGKNASLGELYRRLSGAGVLVPDGFATTAEGYRLMLARAGVDAELEGLFADIDLDDVADVARRARRARELVYGAGLPSELADEIRTGYRRLEAEYGPDTSVAVRSSATAEDLPNASFAGQQETFLNIKGEASLLDACRRCFASLFTDRAIYYRADNGFDQMAVALSVGVMKMVRSDLACSGVMFTVDTESGFDQVVFISGSYGLGENVVQGAVDPDEFYVHKPTFASGSRAVLRRRLGDKAVKMVLVEGGVGHTTRNVPAPKADRARFCLPDGDVLELARQAIAVENH